MASVLRQLLSRWSILVDGVHASPLECYAAIEEAIQRREIPGAKTSRVWFKESLLSAERLYLRVSRNQLGVDICAAPFGAGFFLSWRFGKLRPSNYLGCAMLLLFFWSMEYCLDLLGKIQQMTELSFAFTEFLVLRITLLSLAFWVVGMGVRKGCIFSEDAILNMPLIGFIYNLIFRPPTYYKLDTIDVFQKAVHAAVLEVVDDLVRMRGKGLRTLAPAPPPAGTAISLARLSASSLRLKLSHQISSSRAHSPFHPRSG